MKILFNGLGPKDTITYEGRLHRNGSVVDMDESNAAAYLSAHMAVEVKTEAEEKEAMALQRLEEKNADRRKKIEEKAGKAGE